MYIHIGSGDVFRFMQLTGVLMVSELPAAGKTKSSKC